MMTLGASRFGESVLLVVELPHGPPRALCLRVAHDAARPLTARALKAMAALRLTRVSAQNPPMRR